MTLYNFIDVAPDPVVTGVGILAVVVLFVVGFVILLGAGLVMFLWLRKRSTRHLEAVRTEVQDTLN